MKKVKELMIQKSDMNPSNSTGNDVFGQFRTGKAQKCHLFRRHTPAPPKTCLSTLRIFTDLAGCQEALPVSPWMGKVQISQLVRVAMYQEGSPRGTYGSPGGVTTVSLF